MVQDLGKIKKAKNIKIKRELIFWTAFWSLKKSEHLFNQVLNIYFFLKHFKISLFQLMFENYDITQRNHRTHLSLSARKSSWGRRVQKNFLVVSCLIKWVLCFA